MKRFITYIYEYKNGQKCSNTGFMKVDWRQEQCRLEVHIRNLTVKQESVSCYWVVKRNQKTTGIPFGEIAIVQGKGDGQIVFSRQDGNLDFEMEDVIGIAIKGGQTGYLATSWVDEPGIEFLYGKFAVGQKKEAGENTEELVENRVEAAEVNQEPGRRPTPEPERRATPEPERRPNPEPERRPNPEPIPPPYPGSMAEPEPGQDLEPERIPVPGPPQRPIPGQSPRQIPQPENPPADPSDQRPDEIRWNEPWFIPGNEPQRAPMESQEQEHPKISEQEQKNPAMRRIDINDIRTLPSANWYLCNNSFLIHGFFNYKYLVIKEIEENGSRKSYLGVPGIFERPERTMALLFGFPKFEPEASALQGKTHIPVMAVSEEIQDIPDGTFGYWFCLLDM